MEVSQKVIEPKVSIVIVNYNGYKDTIECLESIRKIKYSNYDVIVVDNASTDNSVDVIKDHITDEILLCSDDNLGFSAGNNIGIRVAIENGSDYVLLLNNDTVVEDSFLSHLVTTAVRHEKTAIVTAKILYYDNPSVIWYAGGCFSRKTSRVSHRGINARDNGQYNRLEEVSFISGCCMLIPIAIVNSVGELNEDFFLYCEDLDYCCEVFKAGFKMIYDPESIIYHKVSSTTGRSSDISTYYTVRNKYYIIDKHIRGFYKQMSRIYLFLQNTRRIKSSEYSYRMVNKAISDYKHGVIGKISIN